MIIGEPNFDEGASGYLPPTPKISTKIKPIDIEDANAEVEKGELILDPQTGTLHKALGKPHSKGGTPVNLRDGSFIFSNFKNLAFSKKEKNLFEFKKGGIKLKNNTPSKILEREVDIEHHNKMIDILQNEKKYDSLANNSAKLMMLKNLEKIGQVAFLQESKKGDSIPSFAQDTAPIYSQDTDEQITQSMQYLKYGGKFLPKFVKAGLFEIPCPCGKNPDGSCKPCTDQEYQSILPKARQVKAAPSDYQFLYKDPKTSTQLFGKFSDRVKQKAYNGPMMGNEKWKQWLKTPDGMRYSAKQKSMQSTEDYVRLDPENPKPVVKITPSTPEEPFNATPAIPGKANELIDPQTYNTQLTPWQKLNLLIPFYRAATVKALYPLRQHQENVIPQFENQDVQPQLDANNQAYFNTANLTRTLIPNQAASYLQQLWGNRINANNQAIAQTQNNNIQTQNRQKELAANSLNQDAAQNRAFDLKYYDQVQTVVKNRDELKQAYEQQGINNINETMTKKLAFDSWLNTQQQYKGKPTYIDKDGVQHYQGQALYTPKPGFFGYSVGYNPVNVDFSTYQSPNNKVDSMNEVYAAFAEAKKYDPELKLADFLKFKGLQNYTASQLPLKKKGGKFDSFSKFKNKLY